MIDLQTGESSLSMSTLSTAGVILPAPGKFVSTRFLPSLVEVFGSLEDDPPEVGLLLEELPEPPEDDAGTFDLSLVLDLSFVVFD